MFTYDDLIIHQDILKRLLLNYDTSLLSCHIMENDTFVLENGVQSIATIMLGSRIPFRNFNVRQVANISKNGLIYYYDKSVSRDIYAIINLWLLSYVSSAITRHHFRNGMIKDELIETVWHPNNVFHLVGEKAI